MLKTVQTIITGGGVSSIAAGNNITITPPCGKGNVIISSSSSGSSPGGSNGQFQVNACGAFGGIGYTDFDQNIIVNGSSNTIFIGGSHNFIGNGYCNSIVNSPVYDNFIGGGDCNSIQYASLNVIGGGNNNSIQHGCNNFIGSGCSNSIQNGYVNSIGGGCHNSIQNGDVNFIGDGCHNSIQGGLFNFIGSGLCNVICCTSFSVIPGGNHNLVTGSSASAFGDYAWAFSNTSTAIGTSNNFCSCCRPKLGGSQTATVVLSQRIPTSNTTTEIEIDIPPDISATGDLTYQGVSSVANNSVLSGRTFCVINYGVSSTGDYPLYITDIGDGSNWSVTLTANSGNTGFVVTITTDGTMDTNWTFALVLTKTAQSLT